MDKRKGMGVTIFVLCITAFFLYAYLLMLSEWSPIVLQLSILMIAGVVIGSWWSQRFDGERLKRIFAWFLLALAAFIIIYECFFKI